MISVYRLGFLVTAIFLFLSLIDAASSQQQHEHTNQNKDFVSGSSAENAEEKTWYTCGMHPEVIEDHPGDCPKCGMKLLPMDKDRAQSLGLISGASTNSSSDKKDRKILYWKSPMVQGEIHQSSGKDSMGHDLVAVYEDEAVSSGVIRISPVIEQNMGVRTAEVIKGTVVRTVRTVGFVNFDETTLTSVTTKVNGWIEKLYVEKTGSQVHKGEKLFDIYSPELFSAQEEYLAALRGNRRASGSAVFSSGRLDTGSLVEDARKRLQYFDVSAEQIQNLEKAGKLQKALTILSPSTGIVTHKAIVQGQMIKAGEDLFKIADLSTVWVIAKIYENDLPYVKVGQAALMNLNYLPGKTFRGYVTYIYPYLDEKTREISLRIEFHNPGYELKPGMFATVQLTQELRKDAVLVPDMAVINTGLRKVAFVNSAPGQFQLRNVSIGTRSENNYLEVLSGLKPGEKVVISGQFLLDSESRLREAALKFLKPEVVSGSNPAENPKIIDLPKTSKTSEREKTYYACPMPEHVDTLYDNPGKCPLCGMTLVPVPNPVEPDASAATPIAGGATHVH